MAFKKPIFQQEVISAIKNHALEEYPKEACGIIVAGEYIKCANVAADPLGHFEMDPVEISEHLDAIEAVVHSHPDGKGIPSSADMQSQIDMDCIYGIVPCNKNEAFDPVWWGDFLLEEPLIGRTFVHGVNDCYTTIRAYFWQTKGVKLKEIPRDMDWWTNGGNVYLDNFTSAGFKVIDKADVKDGDCFIGKVAASVPNHGGVILDVSRGLALHHLNGRLSRREPLGRWQKFVTYYLRYEDDNSTP